MANPMREKAIEGLRTGACFRYRRIFTEDETHSFGDITRDYNPVHYDDRWVAAKGFRDRICHGLLVGSMICEFGGQVGWLATGMEFKFVKPVYFGDTIDCTVTIKNIEDEGRAAAEAVFRNQHGTAVCYARLTGRLPQESERELLERMAGEGDPTNRLSNEVYEHLCPRESRGDTGH
jgi:acyl dehydratase